MARYQNIDDAHRNWRSYAFKRAFRHFRGLRGQQRPLLQKLLKQARHDAKMSQDDAGTRLGEDQTFISKIESGKRALEFIEVEHLAEIYGKPVEYFATIPQIQKKRQRS